jgi:hypothetical protein
VCVSACEVWVCVLSVREFALGARDKQLIAVCVESVCVRCECV